MQGEKLRVLIQRPGEPAEEKIIIDKLDSFYKEIGTDIIEMVRFPGIPNCTFIIDEEGKLRDEVKPNIYLPEYDDALVGTVVIAGDDGMGELIDLTDEQIGKIKPYLQRNDMSGYAGKIEPQTQVYAFDTEEEFFEALFGGGESDDEAEM